MLVLKIIVALLAYSTSYADIELPLGSIQGCPFLHDDSYDLAPTLQTLQTQLSVEMKNRNYCKAAIQGLISNITPLNDFYKTIDSASKQKIANSIYLNTLNTLRTRKLELETTPGGTSTDEYQSIATQISTFENSRIYNEIDLQSSIEFQQSNTEAYYRNQLAQYTTNALAAYNSTLRSNPECIGKMGGGTQALGSILGGFSLATGLGVNATAQVIGVAIGATTQLINLLQDAKIRTSYNDLVRLKNYKTLACTYYSIKKTACEYKRTYKISQDVNKLRKFAQNKFDNTETGEFERYFVNNGRITNLSDVFSLIARMGSPLTLDLNILSAYLTAKRLDFDALGPAPSVDSSDNLIKVWLLRARSFGVSFSETNYSPSGQIVNIPIKDQLQQAILDIENKRQTIVSAETIMRQNPSFLDLRRKLASEFPNIETYLVEMQKYLNNFVSNKVTQGADTVVIQSGLSLINKLLEFIRSSTEEEIVAKGGSIFQELAKGSVAQLTDQSVLGLSSKGLDRLSWSFGVIRNYYLQTKPNFAEFQKNRNTLSDIIANYQTFSGSGTIFRNEDFAQAYASFEDGFKTEMLKSLELAIENQDGLPELKGQTAAHLCALYASSLSKMNGKAKRIQEYCQSHYKTLQNNKLVADKDFAINYGDECTYINYSRELEIQNILARLIQ